MTELVRSQLLIFSVMGMGGLAAGLIHGVFRLFIQVKCIKGWKSWGFELISYAVIGFMVSEFFYYCDNGKITFMGIGSFVAGLWLWKKFFCDILTAIGGNNGEEKRHGEPI